MSAKQTAIDTLVEIAKKEEFAESDDPRTRAACAILDRLAVIDEGSTE